MGKMCAVRRTSTTRARRRVGQRLVLAVIHLLLSEGQRTSVLHLDRRSASPHQIAKDSDSGALARGVLLDSPDPWEIERGETNHGGENERSSPVTSNNNVTVFGAYGHTGRFVISELRHRGWTPILSGRDPDKLNALGEVQPGLNL